VCQDVVPRENVVKNPALLHGCVHENDTEIEHCGNKISEIAFTHTVVDPGAVVIEPADAAIAHLTVL